MSVRTPRRPPLPRRTAALAWLVALCLLLAGVAPAVSQALAADGRAAALHDLCFADAERPAAPVGHHGGTDEPACALCVTHGGTHAAPPAPAPAVPAPPVAHDAAMARTLAPPARGGRLFAEPRGPPAAPHAA